MRIVSSVVATLALLAGISVANATVQVAIDLTHQRMHVQANEGTFDWPISSARSGFYTPGGSYSPTHLELMHYSKKYHMSPMPHAIFFRGGYAIHGTYSTGALGRPASHGCVRLSPGNAATLYSMVQHEGARISIAGSPPASRPFYEAEGARPRRSRDRTALASVAPPPTETVAYQTYGDAAYATPRRPRTRAARLRQQQYYAGYADAPGYNTTPQLFGLFGQ